jgi:hypothetical protein
MARKRTLEPQPVAAQPEQVREAFAKAVADGDVVNLRLLFHPMSPARDDTVEDLDSAKYDYLLPTDEEMTTEVYRRAAQLVDRRDIRDAIEGALKGTRQARIPWEMLLLLADNAVRAGKYGSAAQAYEQLRIRRRMQDTFYAEADAALEQDDTARAARGYAIATALNYDYAAFPEPLPAVGNWQSRALVLHGQYRGEPGEAVGMRDDETQLRTALNYLLADPKAAARLQERPLETRLAMVRELARLRDPRWDTMRDRVREAAEVAGGLIEAEEGAREARRRGLVGAEGVDDEEAVRPQVILLGRTIEDGAWWQYVKELALDHVPAALLVSRQVLGSREVIVPRFRADSPVARALEVG